MYYSLVFLDRNNITTTPRLVPPICYPCPSSADTAGPMPPVSVTHTTPLFNSFPYHATSSPPPTLHHHPACSAPSLLESNDMCIHILGSNHTCYLPIFGKKYIDKYYYLLDNNIVHFTMMAPESISLVPMGVKTLSLYCIEAVFTPNISMSLKEFLVSALTSIDVLKEGPTGSGAAQ